MSKGLLSPNTSLAINAVCPVNWLCPLNRGRVSWWKPLPGWTGGKQLNDLCRLSHATLTNMDPAADWVSNWLDFDGTNDYCAVPAGKVNINGDLTIEAVFKTTTNVKVIFGAYSTSGGFPGYGLGVGSSGIGNGKLSFWCGNTTWVESTSTICDDGVWVHGVATLSGTTVTMYVNGLADGSATKAPSLAYSGVAAIGAASNGTSPFNGSIKSVSNWDRALSASEVSGLYFDYLADNPATINRIRRPSPYSAAASGPPFHPVGAPGGFVGRAA